MSVTEQPRGRGTALNPENRYERLHVEPDGTADPDGTASGPHTLFYRDASRTVLAENDSPDIGFRFSLNPYRGCEHGCIYCYARPTHEYLSFSAGLDFERRIMVKHDAPERLRDALQSPRWQPQVIALSGNTDCYQPVERQLRLTRRCLEVLRDFRNPVGVVTKSALVSRDADLLAELAADGAAHVCISLTTLDGELARRMEPRAAQPPRRLEAMRALSAAGVPVGVLVAPVIPGLNDEEIPRLLAAAAAAGACSAAWVLLRLPPPVDALFADWLAAHFPARRARVLGRVRACRDGALSDARFGRRMRGTGTYAEQIAALFGAAARRHGLDRSLPLLNCRAFRRSPRAGEQLRLC
jgi:DNA repair photolyase